MPAATHVHAPPCRVGGRLSRTASLPWHCARPPAPPHASTAPCLFLSAFLCRFVVGQPIPAPKLAHEGEPTPAEVDAQHARFYAALRALWDAHAKDFPGYADVKLVVV